MALGKQNVWAACLKNKLEYSSFLLEPWIRLFFESVRVQSTEKAILWGDMYHVSWWRGMDYMASVYNLMRLSIANFLIQRFEPYSTFTFTMLEVDVVFALFCLLLLLLFPWGFGVLSWPDPILPNKSSSQVSSNSSLWYLMSLLQALRWKTVDPDWSALHDFSILNNSSDDVSLIGGQMFYKHIR